MRNNLLPLYLLLGCIPLAVAGQNMFTFIATIILVVRWRKNRERSLSDLWSKFKVPLSLSICFPIWIELVTLLNQANPAPFLRFSPGYFAWILIPPLCWLNYGALTQEDWKKLARVAVGVVTVSGLMALSQNIFGWQLLDLKFVHDLPRARGLYSHPLTFAYVGSFFWPLGCFWVLRNPKHWSGWALLIGVTAWIVFSQSRAIQLVSLMVAIFSIIYITKGSVRNLALVCLVIGSIGILTLPNPVSKRLNQTFNGEMPRNSERYIDDRFAFWDVHWLMIKERPLLGHGAKLDKPYRLPYYEKMDLTAFPKKYEAHNLWIQITSNGGLIGLFLFGSWWLWYLVQVVRINGSQHRFAKGLMLSTWMAFAMGGILQNSFQDSEVRMTLTLVCAAMMMSGLCGFNGLQHKR